MSREMDNEWKHYFKQFIPGEEYIPDHIRSGSLSSFLFFVVIGFVASLGLITRVESSTFTNADDPIGSKIQQIKKEIKSLEIKNTVTESEILLLNHALTQKLENRQKQEILRLSKLTGTNKKIGKGVVLTLADNDKPLKPGENPNFGIIHNNDLLNLVNDLWTGGAEAVSVNNQRITALSEIKCVGPAILINQTRIVPPFTIKAVGSPENLTKSLRNGHLKALELSGIKYFLEKYEQIEIPADGTIILTGEI